MKHLYSKLLTLLALTLILPLQAIAFPFATSSQSQFVPVDQAFIFDFSQKNNELTLNWTIKDGYYLYKKSLSLQSEEATFSDLIYPKALNHHDEFYGDVEIYKEALSLPIKLLTATDNATIKLTYQGCAVAGFCYPPETKMIPLSAISPSHIIDTAQPISPTTEPKNQAPFSPLWALLIGLGIAFTPCVLPMYPLISGIILGGKRTLTFRRTLLLSVVYVQGMALTYTLLGLIVAAAGLQFQAALQHPYVLMGISILFIALALSMFGAYSLQLPSSLQTRLAQWSNTQQGGSLFGVFAMGALAGLICSPCTTAPLTAILLYIAQSGNALIGGMTLYLYALGMGLPLIVVTLFGQKFLPKSGAWMQYVKQAFGFVILALPVFLLGRIVGDLWEMRLWSLLAIATLIWLLSINAQSKRLINKVISVLFIVLIILASHPLQQWIFNTPMAHEQPVSSPFKSVASVAEIELSIKNSEKSITMVDFFAEWCVACKEFEKYTFSDNAVQQRLNHIQLLQADVTKNVAADKALFKRYHVLGLPTIIFLDNQGNEIPNSRITGFMDAERFQAHLDQLP